MGKLYRTPRADDTPFDAGSLGVCHEVNRLSDIEAFYQFETLRSCPPAIQRLARIRMAALRRRLLGEGRGR